MQVRAAEPADAPGIAAVNVAAWRVAYRGLVPDAHLDAMDVARYERGWEGRIAERAPRSVVLVAQAPDGSIAGYVDVVPSRDADADPAVTGEVTSIYVAPDAWGRGTGRALLKAAVDAAGSLDFTELALWVLAGNARGRRFYVAAGWVADGASKEDEIAGTVLSELRHRRAL